MSRSTALWAALTALTLTSPVLTSLLAGCSTSQTAPVPSRPVAVRTVHPVLDTLRAERSYVGTVAAAMEATVIARIPGTLTELPAAEGDAVTPGSVVARIDAPEQGARVRRASADLARLEADRQYACTRAATDRSLVGTGAIASAQRDLTESRCSAAQHAVHAARSAVLELGEIADGRAEKAPFDGRVLRWTASPGEHVMPGRPLLLLGTDAMEVKVAVVEADLRAGVAVGTRARVVLANGETVWTTLTALAPISRGPAHTVEATLELPGDLGTSVPHGSSADVHFVLSEQQNALVVPVDAVRFEGDDAWVFVVEDGSVRPVAVVPGVRAMRRIAVQGPIDTSFELVTGELDALSEGQQVYAVPQIRQPS